MFALLCLKRGSTDMDDYLTAMMALAWGFFALGVSLNYFVRGLRAKMKGARR